MVGTASLGNHQYYYYFQIIKFMHLVYLHLKMNGTFDSVPAGQDLALLVNQVAPVFIIIFGVVGNILGKIIFHVSYPHKICGLSKFAHSFVNILYSSHGDHARQ